MTTRRSPSWLLDKSAYVKMTSSPDEALWSDRVERGLIRIAAATVLEIGYSAQNGQDWQGLIKAPPVSLFVLAHATPAIELRAIDVQQALAQLGHHRAPSVADLLIAATAEALGLVVLHDDKDFGLIAEVTGQSMERLRT